MRLATCLDRGTLAKNTASPVEVLTPLAPLFRATVFSRSSTISTAKFDLDLGLASFRSASRHAEQQELLSEIKADVPISAKDLAAVAEEVRAWT